VGRREWVGLAALVVAILLAAGFFVVDTGETAHLPKITPTPAPQGTPATPQDMVPAPSGLPTSILPPPTGPWKVQFISNDASNKGAVAAEGSLPGLDFSMDGAPSQALKDDAWGLDASAAFILPAGRYAFDIQHTGPVDVFIDNVEMARQGANAAGQCLRIEVESKGGVSVILIVANDTGGPFRLNFVTVDPKTLN